MVLERTAPNVLVTGTPGTGKTTTCEAIAERTGLRHINVSDLVKAQHLHQGWDAEHEALIIDEDKVIDYLEEAMGNGGVIIDYHSCDFFPERWFDLVIVLQTDNTILYERLEKRGYSQMKITENVTCEIMHVLVEEARESYRDVAKKFFMLCAQASRTCDSEKQGGLTHRIRGLIHGFEGIRAHYLSEQGGDCASLAEQLRRGDGLKC